MNEQKAVKVCDMVSIIKVNINYIEKCFNNLQDIRLIINEMRQPKKDVNHLTLEACDSLECSFCDDIVNRISRIKNTINELNKELPKKLKV